MLRKIALLMVGAMALTGPASYAQQVQWPTRSIRLIVPFAAGGAADVLARQIAQKLSERWGQPVTVDNKAGGNTIVGAVEAARAAPDGYTLFQAINATLSTNQLMYSKLPYDPARSFAPIGVIGDVPLILISNDTLPAKTIKEFISYAKQNPDAVTLGGASTGSQLIVERLMRDWGIKVRYIPYKSGADITKGLLSGEIQVGLDAVPNYQAHINAGKLRGLVALSSTRLASLPDVPTAAEVGLRDSGAPVWHALLAPAGLAPDVHRKISTDVQAVLAMPEVREALAGLGVQAVWMGPDEITKRVNGEVTSFGPLVTELGLKIE